MEMVWPCRVSEIVILENRISGTLGPSLDRTRQEGRQAKRGRSRRAKEAGVQVFENARCNAIANFAALSDQRLAEAETQSPASSRFAFVSSRFVFVSPDFASLRRAPALARSVASAAQRLLHLPETMLPLPRLNPPGGKGCLPKFTAWKSLRPTVSPREKKEPLGKVASWSSRVCVMAFHVDRSRTIISAMIFGRKLTAMDVAWLRREVFASGALVSRSGGRAVRRRARAVSPTRRNGPTSSSRRSSITSSANPTCRRRNRRRLKGALADRARRRMRLRQRARRAGDRARRGAARARGLARRGGAGARSGQASTPR